MAASCDPHRGGRARGEVGRRRRGALPGGEHPPWGRRELLYGLNAAREKLLQSAPEAEETAQVNAAYLNLIRMWSDI